MVMDRNLSGCSVNGTKLNDEPASVLSDSDPNPYPYNSFMVGDSIFNDSFLSVPSYSSDLNPNFGSDSYEDADFSNVVLEYINQMLMEGDMEEKACMFQESAALQAAEKSFYDVLGKQYPANPSPDQNPLVSSHQSSSSGGSSSSRSLLYPGWNNWYESPFVQQSVSNSSIGFSSSNAAADSPDIFSDSFKELLVDSGNNGLSVNDLKDVVLVKEEEEKSRGKKNPYSEDLDLEEGRSNKQSALHTESAIMSDMFDKVLLCTGGASIAALREELQSKTNKNGDQNNQSNGGKLRGKKKKGGKRDVVDLRTLLSLCAQAIAADNQRSANEYLKQIRAHSSSTGDGMQRMANYFADGLEARMAGSGTQIYRALITKPTSAADVLKAYHLYLATCPFLKISHFFSNRTIMNVAENAKSLHIIDFGILYGFQWPCLIQHLAARSGGPPELRITGIDFPHPGFRPSERVEETGRRLANYAEKFKVPFTFNAIAQKWETVRLEDLKIKKDEVLVVNCMNRFRNLLDETVVVDCPRNIVLNLIRKMNPDIFIQGIVNGSYNAPFFITRFREALFHFSSLFDMLETNVPREVTERILIEKTIVGREAMNVIACEGGERIERPETYKQWQVRNKRVGFKQLPLNREIMKKAKDRVESTYHKDFIIDEDGKWMLQGWKGKILFAISSWAPR